MKDEIQSLMAILAVIVGVLGFSFTIVQLVYTKNTLRATNTYQIQKDARSIIESLQADSQFVSTITSGVVEKNNDAFLDGLWRMFNFYLSVFRQDDINGISPGFSSSMRRDFCQFLQKKAVTDGWLILEARGSLGPAHKEMRREWCDVN